MGALTGYMGSERRQPGAVWYKVRLEGMWGNQSPQTLLEGMGNGTVAIENSLAVPPMLNTEYHLNQQFNSTPRHIPKGNENICSHKNLNTNVLSSSIHNGPKGETTETFINW